MTVQTTVLTIPAHHVPQDAPESATGLSLKSYVPRCRCGWAGPRTVYRDKANLNLRLHLERCDAAQEQLW